MYQPTTDSIDQNIDGLSLHNRWCHFVEQRPILLTLSFWLVLAPLVLLAIMLKLAHWQAEQIDAIVTQATNSLETRQQQTTQALDNTLNHLKGLPEFLAFEPIITQTLQTDKETSQHDITSTYLKKVTRFLSVDFAFLINTKGICIASSNFDAVESFVGIDYHDRTYFKESIQGKLGHQYAMGRKTNIPGLFFSAPVYNNAGNIIGVVVTKTDIPNIQKAIKLNNEFLSDDQGVIILSSDPRLMFKTLPNAPILMTDAEFKQNRYKRDQLPALDISSANIANFPEINLLDHSGFPVLTQDITRPFEGFTLHLMEPMPRLQSLKEQGDFVFIIALAGALGALWSIIASIIFLLRTRLYRKKMHQTHAELLRLNTLLKQQAETDFLTGCMNRRYFDQTLKAITPLCRQQNKALSLAVFDIDFFKQINDEHGHDIGDKVLQHLSQVVRQEMQLLVYFARIGGEEFAILMPETTSEIALSLMESLRSAVTHTPLLYGDLLPIPVTISIGVTTANETDSATSLLQRADHCMYQAKRSGRNQVIAG